MIAESKMGVKPLVSLWIIFWNISIYISIIYLMSSMFLSVESMILMSDEGCKYGLWNSCITKELVSRVKFQLSEESHW